LLKAGGDFNQIDDFGFTPLAYGTQDLLKSLGLFNGVVSVNLDTKQPFTPNFDNNALFYSNNCIFVIIILLN
jgi:hypothetical protein